MVVTKAEKRQHWRQPVELPGLLVLPDDHEISCRARNLSEHGVRVAMRGAPRLPPILHFIDVLSGTAYPAELVWITETEAGLSFNGSIDLMDEPETHLLRRKWLQRTGIEG